MDDTADIRAGDPLPAPAGLWRVWYRDELGGTHHADFCATRAALLPLIVALEEKGLDPRVQEVRKPEHDHEFSHWPLGSRRPALG